MSQPLTFEFSRGLLRCPSCNLEIWATYCVSTTSDQIAPINPIDGSAPQRFELTGELLGVRVQSHSCIPEAES